jgi:hypothetical protein
VIFTPLSCAECQKAIRERIMEFSGAGMVGKSKQIVGKRDRIVDAMTRISLDSSWLLKVQSRRLERNYPRHAGYYGGGYDVDTDEEKGSEDLDDFIDDDEEEDEDEENLKGFVTEDEEDEPPRKRSPSKRSSSSKDEDSNRANKRSRKN